MQSPKFSHTNYHPRSKWLLKEQTHLAKHSAGHVFIEHTNDDPGVLPLQQQSQCTVLAFFCGSQTFLYYRLKLKELCSLHWKPWWCFGIIQYKFFCFFSTVYFVMRTVLAVLWVWSPLIQRYHYTRHKVPLHNPRSHYTRHRVLLHTRSHYTPQGPTTQDTRSHHTTLGPTT